ncbi:PDZ domain-containing protein [Longimicrobium sp.]|uniref:PDZ domain-containing protein n=1 Tax=Longimicrobium sp. TaxID=2029185 RepID=UPI003B3A5473
MRTSITWLALLCAVPLLLSASSAPAAQGACGGEPARGHLGVRIGCDCTVSSTPSADKPWRFRSAIRVDAVEADGPAAGVLRRGDVITAVDGAAVTEAEGARRLWQARPGQPVRLSIERDGQRMEVTLRTAAICADDRRAIGSYAPAVVGPDVPGASSFGARTPAPEAVPGAPSSGPVPVPTTPGLQPEGWLGFGLACNQCGWARAGGDAAPYWESAGEPILYTVQPGSPAARAGLRDGDVLTHVGAHAITSREGGRALGAVRPDERLALRVRRAGRPMEVALVAGRRPAAPPAVRYAGQVGGVRVELSGAAPSDVSVDEETGEMSITVNGATVRLRPRD